MDQDRRRDVEFPEQEKLVSLLTDVSRALETAKGLVGSAGELLDPASDEWDLQPGEVGVLLLPTDPPQACCILEHGVTGHWMLQYPCGGIFVLDITTGQPTY